MRWSSVLSIGFRTLDSSQPAYLRSSLHACHSTRSLRLSNTNLLSAPFVRTSFGARGFSVAAPKIWNSLPPSLLTRTSPDTFRRHPTPTTAGRPSNLISDVKIRYMIWCVSRAGGRVTQVASVVCFRSQTGFVSLRPAPRRVCLWLRQWAATVATWRPWVPSPVAPTPPISTKNPSPSTTFRSPLLCCSTNNTCITTTTNGSFPGQPEKGKTSRDLNEARDDGILGRSGISWTICKQSAPHSRQLTTPTPNHSRCSSWRAATAWWWSSSAALHATCSQRISDVVLPPC